MASKLTLDFTDSGVIGETITIKTGVTYTFAAVRDGWHKVEVNDYWLGAKRFKEAYNLDDNFLNNSTVIFTAFTDPNFGRVTIEKFNNDGFDGFVNNTSFITSSITTTPQEITPTLSIARVEATTNKCGEYGLDIDTNVIGGRVEVEIPAGNKVFEAVTDGNTIHADFVRTANVKFSKVKLFKTETATSPVLSREYVSIPFISISDVEVSGSPFGAAISIKSNIYVAQQFSLDGVTYQGSRNYTGLTEGSYTAYAKDDYGCVSTRAFSVSAEQAGQLTVKPYIKVPIHNSIRFAQRTGGNFLNFLSTETPGLVGLNHYYQDYLQSDIVKIQFKSSYTNNKAYLIDCNGAEVEIAITQKSTNINRTNIYEGNYADYDGRLAVYFGAGNIYNEDNSVQAEGHILNGLLPVWYKEGMFINIEGIGSTQIERIEFDEITETVYAITQFNGVGAGTSKKITSIHTEHPYEVYEFDINFNLAEGYYQIRLEYGSDFFLSEIIKVSAELDENFLTVIWYNDVNNDILYNTGIQQLRRLEWENYFSLISKNEQETYDTDTSVELIKSKSFAVYDISFRPMPMEVARGLVYAFVNSNRIVINGAVFICETDPKIKPIGGLYAFEAQLTLTDQTMKGQQVLVDVVSAAFLQVAQDSDGTGYLLL